MIKWIIGGAIAIAAMFALLLKGGGEVSMLGEHGGEAHPPAAEKSDAKAATPANAPAAAPAAPAAPTTPAPAK